ncbi:Nucleoside-triphosphatase THEP1 [Saccharicrinis carchari]|uniref:Nucleoside-triphosphatase THEP1 n=1 Tax=Saccharicrinis carchari TaxID=1168039 RepID=A0A521C4W8_SACCC|nr:nucleoside-triphosphatase [Saccharicrinis carchari]SMO54449.1 Nucleoside-triphosphatase THEP1 [Saccharicrinis carchari]
MKPIFIIAGEKGSGKTSFLLQLINLLETKRRIVAGFVSAHDLKSDIYSIKNIQTHQKVNLMERVDSFHQRPHHFKLFTNAVEVGNNWINTLLKTPPHIGIIDEIGSYELMEELWAKSFTQLIKSPLPIIFTCKKKHLKAILEKWNIEPKAVFYPHDFNDPLKAFKQIDGLW